jgi:hypothetical protein
MFIRKLFCFALMMLFLAIASNSYAGGDVFKPGSEPDGFRGIKWGADIGTLHNMEFIGTDPDNPNTKVYERKGDIKELGAAKLNSISYAFWNGKFCIATVLTTREVDYDNLKNVCFEKFGKGVQNNQFMENYIWFGDKARMSLKYNEISKIGNLTIFSTDITNRIISQQDRKNNEGATNGF